MLLVVAEQRSGSLNPATLETIAAAQTLQQPICVAVVGSHVGDVALELSSCDVSEVLTIDDVALEPYTSDGFVVALSQVVEQERPEMVLFPHTYQTRDFAPALASRLKSSLIADCVGVTSKDGKLLLSRPMFQGKFVAEVVPVGTAPHFVSFQIGAFRADSLKRVTNAVKTREISVSVDPSAIRQRPEDPFKEAKQAVDLTQAERIVAVGRGIKGEEHLPLAQDLAKALGGELAASRPICDSGWLPMDRQVGSSGQTVAPTLYLALGISGAIQHLVGMKGSRTIVAINKDADAPIFEVADYGIVGDLFEIVPALVAALGD